MTSRYPGLAALVVTAALLAPAGDPVAGWIRDHARPVGQVERSIGAATVVGLGESVHGAKEETDLKFRTLRMLVQQRGFRSLAWEEDWTTGRRIDRYLTTGRGGPRALAGRMTGQWRSRQVMDVLRWLRRFNAGRADKVRFAGVEFYYTGRPAYRAIDTYVAGAAPRRLPSLRADLRPIWPTTADPGAYAAEYQKVPDKRPYIRHAHRVLRLLRSLPHRTGDRRYALAVQDARQIVSFHVFYAMGIVAQNVYREAHAARNLRWWQRFTGDRVAYWAASAHTANAPDLRMTMPQPPDLHYASAGSYLRRWYGPRYRSIGFTFDHGTIGFVPGGTQPMPPPAAGWFEHPLGDHQPERFTLDLRRPAPPRAWLTAPLVTRGIPNAGPGATISGGTLGQWFDVLVHTQRVTPLNALP